MKIVTHNGHFHTDELMAVATLLRKFPDAEVVRSRDEAAINSADIAVDVGQIYAPDKMCFDHHQPEGAGVRENGIPYASFGLIWGKYGAEISGGDEEAKIIEERLVLPVDAEDNGIHFSTPLLPGTSEYSIGDFVESFALGSKRLDDYEKGFFQVLPILKQLLMREITNAEQTVSDWREVEKIYNDSEEKKIIVLPSSMHWKKVLIPTEALYVISFRQDNKWGVRAVPKEFHSYEVKKPFPQEWAGLSGEALAKVSGVSDAQFCHNGRWLANAGSKEGAVKLAEKALNQ